MARRLTQSPADSAFEHELLPLVHAVAERRLILFVGGGVSQNLGLPDFKALVHHMASDLGFRGDYGVSEYSVIAEAYLIKHAQLGALRSWMDTTWHPPSIDITQSELHNLIVDLDFPTIYTTNYDRWLERSFEARRKPFQLRQHMFSGFAAHWNMNSNLGQAFDVWFLNLFPRTSPFRFNGGGYLTLSFIPTLGTMLLGLIGGRWFMESAPKIPLRKFLLAGAGLIALGCLFHFTGICPIVKRIWTPSWTLFSGGVCFLFLTAFSWIIDVKGNRRIAFPLVVVGMNSIAAYLIAHLWEEFFQNTFRIHLGPRVLNMFGTALEPLFLGALTLLAFWLVLFWMYRKKIFIRI